MKTTAPSYRKHGHARGLRPESPTYQSWHAMLQRCRNRKNPDYGLKGISVCSRWLDFRNFLADMGERPSGTTIERLDNDLGYTPSNCKWATVKEQNWNKRDTVLVMDGGEMIPLKEVARRHNLTYYRLHFWFRKKGLPIAEAMRNAAMPGRWVKRS